MEIDIRDGSRPELETLVCFRLVADRLRSARGRTSRSRVARLRVRRIPKNRPQPSPAPLMEAVSFVSEAELGLGWRCCNRRNLANITESGPATDPHFRTCATYGASSTFGLREFTSGRPVLGTPCAPSVRSRYPLIARVCAPLRFGYARRFWARALISRRDWQPRCIWTARFCYLSASRFCYVVSGTEDSCNLWRSGGIRSREIFRLRVFPASRP